MKTILLLITTTVLLNIALKAQRGRGDTLVLVTGQILVEQENQPLPFATVYNRENNRGTITDTLGLFSIYALKKDSIKVSFIGFYTQYFCLLDSTVGKEHFVEIKLKRRVHELREINIRAITWQQFKNQIINMQLDETPGPDVRQWLEKLFDPYDLAAMRSKDNPGGGSFSFSIPTWHDKSRKKVTLLEQQKRIDLIIDKKFNNKVVNEVTGLEGDELIYFMKNCNFDRAWLLRSTEYDVLVEIKRLFGHYINNRRKY